MGNDETKRRLPPWMTATSTATTKNHQTQNENKPSSSKSSSLLVRGGGDDDDSLENKQKKKKKKKRKVIVTADSPKSNKKPKPKPKPKPKAKPQRSVDQEEDGIEEEVELTVDDLITIAQEYVRADEAKERQGGATTSRESGKQVPAISPFARQESRASTCLDAAQSSGSFPTHATSGHLREPEDSTTREDITVNPSRTGDSTQDMLDLFLGPLLKKPQMIEEPKLKHAREDLILDYEIQKHSQREEVFEANANAPVLMKKKSSLRDTVAMLFD